MKLFRKTRYGLVPSSLDSQQLFDKIGMMEEVEAVFKKVRNPDHHRKFFYLIELVLNNTDEYVSKDHLRFTLMAVLHRGEWIKPSFASKEIFIPQSISFEKMDQCEFDEFYEEAKSALIKYFVPIDRQDLERELISC